MNIWIVETGEPLLLEKDVRLHRNGQLAKGLAAKGHEVHLFTSTFSHLPKINFGDKDFMQIIDGVNCHFLWTAGYQRNVSLARIKHNKLFAKKYFDYAVKLKKPDVILSPIPVIESAVSSLRLKQHFGCKLVTDIRDVWPDELKNLAPKPLRPLARIALFRAYNNMQTFCSNVDGLIAIATEQLEYGKRFTNNSNVKTKIIPFGYESLRLSEVELLKEMDWLQGLGVDFNKKSACFIGTLGRFFNLDTVFDVAKKMPGVQFLMAGKGDLEDEFRQKTKDLPNVFWLGWVNQPKIQALMKVSHIGLGPYKKGSWSLTNKPIEYISGGLPVVHSIEGDFKSYSERYACGKYYDEADASSLQKALEYYLKDDAMLENSSRNALKCFNDNFQLTAVVNNFESFFKEIL
jgi:glycosyltransferase involved in cell wall biosynthesis